MLKILNGLLKNLKLQDVLFYHHTEKLTNQTFNHKNTEK